MKNTQFGFTLLEMAIVLMIIGILLGALVPTLSAQMESQHINETRKQMDEIQQSLIGYAIVNGRLPCPAQSDLVTGTDSNAGIEAVTGTTCACKTSSGSGKTIADMSASKVACTDTTVAGVLPWATLGINEGDAWDHRFTYRVAIRFADQIAAANYGCTPTTNPIYSSFALCSPGIPDVLTAAVGGNNVATDVPLVVVSHGKNGYGAYLSSGSVLATSSNADEAENSDNDDKFVSHDLSESGFDDLVVWLSPNILLNRMVVAGKLP